MKKYILLALVASFFSFSCTKHVTEVTEVQGENQAHSAVYTIMPEDWQLLEDDSDSDPVNMASLPVPEITDDILDHGAVIVFLSFVDGEYEAIPQVYKGLSYIPIHYEGGVDIEVRDIDHVDVPVPDGEIWAKVVIIDADKLAMHPNVNLQNYGEVQRAFGVE